MTAEPATSHWAFSEHCSCYPLNGVQWKRFINGIQICWNEPWEASKAASHWLRHVTIALWQRIIFQKELGLYRLPVCWLESADPESADQELAIRSLLIELHRNFRFGSSPYELAVVKGITRSTECSADLFNLVVQLTCWIGIRVVWLSGWADCCSIVVRLFADWTIIQRSVDRKALKMFNFC